VFFLLMCIKFYPNNKEAETSKGGARRDKKDLKKEKKDKSNKRRERKRDRIREILRRDKFLRENKNFLLLFRNALHRLLF